MGRDMGRDSGIGCCEVMVSIDSEKTRNIGRKTSEFIRKSDNTIDTKDTGDRGRGVRRVRGIDNRGVDNRGG